MSAITVRSTITAAEIRNRLMSAMDGQRAPVVEVCRQHVEGALDCANMNSSVALIMRDCTFAEPVNLAGARFPELAFTDGCQVPSINADHIAVAGDVTLTGLFCGKVDLSGARPTDDLHAENTHLSPGAPALNLHDAKISGGLFGERLTARGMSLEGANVANEIDLTGASLTASQDSADGMALNANGLTAGGGIVARRLTVVGCATFIDAQCTTTFDLRGAQLTGATGDSNVLRMDRCHITGSLDCGEGFRATSAASTVQADEARFTPTGAVHLSDARIDGYADFTGAEFRVKNGAAVIADRVTVAAGFLVNRVDSNGTIRLRSGHVGCDLLARDVDFRPADQPKPKAIDLYSATIGGTLRIETTGPERLIDGDVDLCRSKIGTVHVSGLPPRGVTDFTGASVTVLLDEPDRYLGDADLGGENRLVLNGLTYGSIHMSGVELDTRLDWLRAGTREIRSSSDGYQPPPTGFVPQPYEQLASAYRQVGQTRDARIILLHEHRAKTRGIRWNGPKWPLRIVGYVEDALVGYGYAPGRAFAWVLALWTLGGVYFGLNPPNPATATQKPFTGLDAFQYPLELLLPGIGVGSGSAWQPVSGFGQALALVLIIAGWLLGITIIAGVTRALQRN